MRVAVIGGSGFIGARIVDALIEGQHDVTVFDIMKPNRGDVQHITLDVTDASKVVVALAGGFDAIYLLAAVANVNDVYMIPVESTYVNVMSTANVLEAARRTGAGRVILASTTWVYNAANTEQGTVDEDSSFCVDRVGHVYTATKLGAELLTHAYGDLYKLPFTILRYGIPYGPGGRVGTVITNFVRRALAGEALLIQGSGDQWRSFVYVDDLARANVAALSPVAEGRTYNIEGPRRVTIREVAETVRDVVSPSIEIKFEDASRSGDFLGRTVSGERARVELGWVPTTELRTGIQNYVDWVRAERK